jgi:hypothetical protein
LGIRDRDVEEDEEEDEEDRGCSVGKKNPRPQALMWATNNVLLFGCPPKLPTKTKVVLAQYCQ